MFGLFDKIYEMILVALTSSCVSSAKGFYSEIKNLLESIMLDGSKTPDAFNNSMFNLAKNVNETVIIPIAGIVIAYFATINLIQVINEKNTFVDNEVQSIFKWLVTTFVAITLVTNSMNITTAIFHLGSKAMIETQAKILNTDVGVDVEAMVSKVESDCKEASKDNDLGAVFKLLSYKVSLSFGGWCLSGVRIIVPIVIYVRFFYIYITIAISSIPMATLTSNRVSSIGDNYIKTLFGLAFQGLILILAVSMYAVFMTTIASTSGDVRDLILKSMTGFIMLAILLLRSEGISKSLFGAS